MIEVKWHRPSLPIPDGWKEVEISDSHHSKHSILIEKDETLSDAEDDEGWDMGLGLGHRGDGDHQGSPDPEGTPGRLHRALGEAACRK